MILPAWMSLRTRVFHATGAMLVPLVIASGVSFLSTRSIVQELDRVASMGLDELEPVSDLQKLILQSAMPPNDYLIHGGHSESELFARLSREVDDAFAAHLSSVGAGGVRDSVVRARGEWEKARALGGAILALPDPVGDPEGGAMMEAFDARIDLASAILEAVHADVRHRVGVAVSQARAVERRNTLLIAGVLLAALALAVAFGGLLGRSLTVPLLALKEGIVRFGQGDHSYRVALDRKDELGQLADIMNAMAERLERDSLTGVYSRREFDRILKAEVARSLRYGRAFSLLVMDIDHFKSVNDTHGHQSGDEVLRAVATIASQALRGSDLIARVGGEEFAILLPETAGDGAFAVAERVRAEIAVRSIKVSPDKALTLTVSIGVAACPEDADAEAELFALADQALYRAKKGGRNRVMRCVRGEDHVEARGLS